MRGQVTLYWDAFRCGVRDWLEFWGDPLLSGTILTVSYAVAAFLIFRASRGLAGRERAYWRLCAALFLFQVANTNMDLHGLVWTTGRCLAHAQGWYEDRHRVQVLLLLAVGAVTVLGVVAATAFFARSIAGNILLTLGVATAMGFTLVKGVGYHNAERLYGIEVGPFLVADLIEFGGILIAVVAAVISNRQRGRLRGTGCGTDRQV